MKQNLTAHDVSALVYEYSQDIDTYVGGLSGMYVENIYDIDKKTIVLKLKYKTVRKYLLIESGIRMHTLEKFDAADSGAPKSFCVKIRKHVRDRRIFSIKQINHDRVVDIQFGPDDTEPYHMILEFYASGNIILTDKKYLILDLVHYHYYDDVDRDNDKELKDHEIETDKAKIETDTIIAVRPGNIYPFEKACPGIGPYEEIKPEDIDTWFNMCINFPTKRKLKDCINFSPIHTIPTVIIEHAMAKQNILLKQKIGRSEHIAFNAIDFIIEIKKMITMFDVFDITDIKINAINTDAGYYPCQYSFINMESAKHYSLFDLGIREWYSVLRGSIESRAVIIPKKTIIKKKSETDKKDAIVSSIKNKIVELESKKTNVTTIIELCEEHAEYLEYLLNYIKLLYDNGYTISREMITATYNHEIFIILDVICTESLKIIVLQTRNEPEPIKIELDWTINLNKNIRNIYNKSKEIRSKISKTEIVMNTLEKKIIKERKIEEETIKLVITRKQLWFEKFNWFYSSDNFIVVSGKDAKSNEYLVKNIMRDSDLYVHTDLPGSGSCIIINPNKLKPDDIGERTKEEAGLFVVAHTKAWDTNTPSSAFWVTGDQVSKTPESGEYVTLGSFIIRGKRNFITPQPIIMGYCILFWNGEILSREKNHDTHFALISCAPYTATSECMYKKKIIPGTGKINKGMEIIISSFKEIDKTKTDIQYIKNIPADDWHRVSPGKLKVM